MNSLCYNGWLDDDTPRATGAAEEREYQVIAVMGDDETGQSSDIASAVWRRLK